jgi:hypothetical protein
VQALYPPIGHDMAIIFNAGQIDAGVLPRESSQSNDFRNVPPNLL